MTEPGLESDNGDNRTTITKPEEASSIGAPSDSSEREIIRTRSSCRKGASHTSDHISHRRLTTEDVPVEENPKVNRKPLRRKQKLAVTSVQELRRSERLGGLKMSEKEKESSLPLSVSNLSESDSSDTPGLSSPPTKRKNEARGPKSTSSSPDPEAEVISSIKYYCIECEKTFGCMSDLMQHTTIHSGGSESPEIDDSVIDNDFLGGTSSPIFGNDIDLPTGMEFQPSTSLKRAESPRVISPVNISSSAQLDDSQLSDNSKNTGAVTIDVQAPTLSTGPSTSSQTSNKRPVKIRSREKSKSKEVYYQVVNNATQFLLNSTNDNISIREYYRQMAEKYSNQPNEEEDTRPVSPDVVDSREDEVRDTNVHKEPVSNYDPIDREDTNNGDGHRSVNQDVRDSEYRDDFDCDDDQGNSRSSAVVNGDKDVDDLFESTNKADMDLEKDSPDDNDYGKEPSSPSGSFSHSHRQNSSGLAERNNSPEPKRVKAICLLVVIQEALKSLKSKKLESVMEIIDSAADRCRNYHYISLKKVEESLYEFSRSIKDEARRSVVLGDQFTLKNAKNVSERILDFLDSPYFEVLKMASHDFHNDEIPDDIFLEAATKLVRECTPTEVLQDLEARSDSS